jgi:hypothetical protein
MRSSSKEEAMRSGMGKEVAESYGGLSANSEPGAPATPWRASFHQLYRGSPILGAPVALLLQVRTTSFFLDMFEKSHLTRFPTFSSGVMAATRAAARLAGDLVVSHIPFELKGFLEQSGLV